MAARIILHTGTSATATAAVVARTARACADRGHRALALSTARLHGLGDAFARLGPGATAPEHREVSVREQLEAHWPLAVAGRAAGPPPPERSQFALALALAEAADAGTWDVVVVDGGPPAELFALASSAELARALLARAEPLGGPEDLRGARAVVAFGDTALRDPERCTARIVLEPGAAGLAAAVRAAAVIAFLELHVDAAVAPGHEPAEAATARAAFAPLAVLTGSGAAGGEEGWAGHDPAAVLHPADRSALEIGSAGASLQIALPYAERSDLGLRRIGSALVLALGEHRRTVVLPPALADYRAVGARFDDGVLRVELVPPSP